MKDISPLLKGHIRNLKPLVSLYDKKSLYYNILLKIIEGPILSIITLMLFVKNVF